MPNNDDQLQQQYQEILNKYASSSIPPEPTPPLVETPKVEELIPSIPETVITTPVVSKPIIKDQLIVPPIYFPPEPVAKKESSFFKYLFYFSLTLFIIVASSIIYNLLNISASTSANPAAAGPTPTRTVSQFCELNDKKYIVGESFPSTDSCNTCSCTPNLTIVCTQKACVTPEPTVKTIGKIYKDIKYSYQFECSPTAKYVVEATSVNGNKIPYKQESCTQDNLTVTVSVYDNTVVHSFGNVETKISPDQKYVVAIEGESSDLLSSVITSFKFL